ncbi:fused MFS/spermidine synthase [Rhodococcus ruber]|uniref:Fused MFS/spermidine synthase n=1 Tax=Rhodococcus ruber TaxID=1830 RepID=A0ABT4M909_9NOCA|nr:fused MFS/spermidine synthase [Rhodococcus ruber]MCZ4517453.1 fused MFS/spermidine synthase [Rhodococcus ruber]
MGRKRATPSAGSLQPGVFEIDSGTCELVRDTFSDDGWVVNVNDVPSSHIDMNDPTVLEFEYMRWISGLVRAQWDSTFSLRALHLGGGACTLARSFTAEFPGARQVVVELDGKLSELVREWFDLPRAPLLRIRVGEARAVTETLSENSRDLIVRDVFAGATTPAPLLTAEFTTHVRRVLSPGGMYVVNCGDRRDLSLAKQEASTIGSIFPHTAIVADPAMLKGRRYGNIIIAGSDVPIGDSPALARELLGGAVPAHVWLTDEVTAFARDAKVLRD